MAIKRDQTGASHFKSQQVTPGRLMSSVILRWH